MILHFILSTFGAIIKTQTKKDLAGLPRAFSADWAGQLCRQMLRYSVLEGKRKGSASKLYDIIIIGAGPAGISAGIYVVSRGKRALIIEKGQVGGIIGKVSTVTHYTAIEQKETGATFAARMKEQALCAGVQILHAEVTSVTLTGEVKTVVTGQGVYEARRIILANGGTPRKLGIPGEAELSGKGMGMNAARDGAAYAGKHVYVVGGADGAVKEALYLASLARHVTIIHFEDQLGCIAEFRKKVAVAGNISLRLSSRLRAVYGQEQVERLEIVSKQDGSVEMVEDPGCGIFVYAGVTPNTALYSELTLEEGYIPTNDKMETAIPGVYAAGDIRVKQVRQVATAVSDGAIAAINAAM